VTLLSGIRNLITRRKPPLAIDIAEPQPDGAVEEEVDVTEPVDVAEELDAIEPVALAVEPEPELEPELEPEPGPSMRAASVLVEPGADVAAVVESIGDRIDAQRDRLDAQSTDVRRLVQHMEQLPRVLKETVEIKGLCARVTELVSGQVSEASTRAEAVIEAVNEAVANAVSAAVKRLDDASSRDAKVLERIQEQLAANARALREAGETEEGVAQNLREVVESSSRVQRVVADLGQSHEQREAQMAKQFAASKRTMLMLAFACTLASLLALVVAVVALLT
jgi:hypothetical protein